VSSLRDSICVKSYPALPCRATDCPVPSGLIPSGDRRFFSTPLKGRTLQRRGFFRSLGGALWVEVCALSALCALWVEVCALSALCALWVEVCALSALCAISPPKVAFKVKIR